MKKVLIDIVDDFRSLEFSPKAWNIIASVLVVLAAYYWGAYSQYGDFFKVTGCIAFVASALVWVNKSHMGQWCLNNLFDDEEE